MKNRDKVRLAAAVFGALAAAAMVLNAMGVIRMTPAQVTLLILAAASVFLVTEAMPLALSAMLVPVLLALNGVLSVKEAFSGFSNENVILFGAMFVVGGAMFRTGVAARIGEAVVRRAKGDTERLVVYVMLSAALLSSVMSNTGTVAVLLPVCVGIADSAGINRKRLLMPLAMMAGLGGMITLVGTPPNINVSAVLQEYGYEGFGFLEFGYIGVPLSLLGGVYLFWVYGRGGLDGESGGTGDFGGRGDKGERAAAAGCFCGAGQKNGGESAGRGSMTRRQGLSLGILAGVVAVMASGVFNLTLGAVTGAVLCVVLGLVTEKEVIEDIDWTTIFLFSGMLPLADAMEKTGAGRMIAGWAVGIMEEQPSDFAVLTVLFAVCALLTQFMSNTAACALLAPIGMEIALALNADPRAVLMMIGIASSCAFATPMAMPPNTLVMGQARAGFMDFVRLGVPLIGVCYVGCMMVVPRVWDVF